MYSISATLDSLRKVLCSHIQKNFNQFDFMIRPDPILVKIDIVSSKKSSANKNDYFLPQIDDDQ